MQKLVLSFMLTSKPGGPRLKCKPENRRPAFDFISTVIHFFSAFTVSSQRWLTERIIIICKHSKLGQALFT